MDKGTGTTGIRRTYEAGRTVEKRAKALSSSGSSRGKSYVGCSGWSYTHWRGIVYDAALSPEGLVLGLCPPVPDRGGQQHLLPLARAGHVQSLAGPGAQPALCTPLKVNQYGTHRRRLREPEAWLPNYVERAVLLGPTLGPNLVQLPPRWKRDPERLGEFLEVATSGALRDRPTLRWAVEFRDPSWLHEDTYEVLRRYKAALCIHDLLAGPSRGRSRPTGPTAGFHGPDALRHEVLGRLRPGAAGQTGSNAERMAGRGLRRLRLFQQRRGRLRRAGCHVAAPAARVVTMPVLAALLPSAAAPSDWVYGTAASIIFVAVIAIPAAVLNSRDHKRRQRERSASQQSG